MTPPHPAWVSSEARAILIGSGHEQKADENQGQGRVATPLLPALKSRGRLLLLTASSLATHFGEQQQNKTKKGQHLSETACFHASLKLRWIMLKEPGTAQPAGPR